MTTFVTQGPDEKLRALFSLHAEPFTLLAGESISAFCADSLAGKTIDTGQQGSGVYLMWDMVAKSYGLQPGAFDTAETPSLADAVDNLCEGRADVLAQAIGHPNQQIAKARKCKATLASLNEKQLSEILSRPYYIEAYIPAGTYQNPDAVKTFAAMATLVTNADLPDEAAYAVTKAVFENLDYFKSMHPALAEISPETMTKANTAPLHPGAQKYFMEKGWL